MSDSDDSDGTIWIVRALAVAVILFAVTYCGEKLIKAWREPPVKTETEKTK